MAKYFITFTPKCYALAVAAVTAKLRAILLNKIWKILQFPHCFVSCAHNSQFSAHCPILRKIRACRIAEFWHPIL